MREVLWERLRRTEIEQAAKAGAVAIIPIASLEQHANHLPVNTDSNIVSTVVRRAAQAATRPHDEVLLEVGNYVASLVAALREG